MSTPNIKPRDWKVPAWLVLVVGVLLTIAGLVGVWLQGMFYARGFPVAATFGEVRAAFTWPTMITVLGTLIVTGVLFASPVSAAWSFQRRVAVFISFGVIVVIASAACGHLAAVRVAKILN